MSLFEKLKISQTRRLLEKNIKNKNSILKGEAQLEAEMESLLESLEKDDSDKFISDWNKARATDLKLLNEARNSGDDELYAKLKDILKALKVLASKKDVFDKEKLIKYIDIILENREIIDTLEVKNETEILREFNELFNSEFRKKKAVERFIDAHSNFFKAKHNKKLRKRMKKLLLIEEKEETLTAGPTIKDKEMHRLKTNLNAYLDSSRFRNLINKFVVGHVNIMINLYGSLVTGFASKESKHRGLPSDYQRISDVDIGITVDTDVITFLGLDGNKLVKNGLYFGPYFESTAEKMGPFAEIFKHINKLSFAGRTDRKIGIIICDSDFYKHNLSSDKHEKIV